MKDLKEIRTKKRLTQKEAADRIGISLRSYVSYENDRSKSKTSKYRFLVSEIENLNPIDEEHGILSLKEITDICGRVFMGYNIDYCYLFGSYAKGKAKETSDIDLLISTGTTGLKYYELVEKLREALGKKVDLLDFRQFIKNENLANEILKEGIRIYG